MSGWIAQSAWEEKGVQMGAGTQVQAQDVLLGT